jgi:DNA-binding protein H-NS
MARRKRRQRKPAAAAEHIGLHEAAVLLEKLREIGHVTAAHVREARTAVVREVEEIVARLAQLKEMAHVPAATPKPETGAEEAPQVRRGSKRRRRAKAPVSAKRRRIQQLQGRYMALGHQIPKSEMSKFREMIKAKGKEATVKAMESYVAKKQKK